MEWVTRQEMKIEYGGGHTGLLLCIRKDPPHAAFDDRCDTTRLSHVRRRCGEARRRCSARDRGPDSGMRAAQLSVPAVIEDFRFVTDSPLEEARFERSVPRYGELGAPGPRATRPRAIVKPRDADRYASTSSASDLRHA